MAADGEEGLATRIRGGLEERIALMAPARRLRLGIADQAVSDFAGGEPIRALDAGCGDGLLSLALARRHAGWEIVGLDYSDDLLAGARERARARSLSNVSFAQADLTKPLPEAGFDVVTAIECLSEIPEDRQAVRMLADALRPGGLFVVQVPDQRWTPILPGSSPTWREEVRHGYTAEGLAEMLETAGLERVVVRPTFRSAVALAQEIRDRAKSSPLAVRLALFPLLAATVVAERRGLTWGPSNALMAVAHSGDGR
jgi:SAM-dependent methyltransferase